MPLSITFIIIAITVVASLYAWRNQNLMENWVHHPQSVAQQNEWWRLLTSGFLHADFMHLFFNMFSLYIFGNVVEQQFMGIFGVTTGAIIYVGLYLVAIIVSDLPSYFKHKNDSRYYSLGASGGVAAIIFASIYFNPLTELIIFPIPLPIKGYIFGALYLFYSYYLSKKGNDGINHSAHFYGAAFGFILSLILVPGHLSAFLGMIRSSIGLF
ncbi:MULTISPECIES: rhomboid family intramembrane serine protease [Rufibacter]|uniref:Membrane associated rhomboid family serine protease n=1 Tax=Rufibacter quisquiliarum TaxID=1549639 RepID=A0A839GQ47_9BACT|nr:MULTISPECIES: rhomboid family intramembrane serine protease [Rufibacter]MBA9075961.1 membrane associated rhomboid family serine protease [Rufibacter quisquiliarum]